VRPDQSKLFAYWLAGQNLVVNLLGHPARILVYCTCNKDTEKRHEVMFEGAHRAPLVVPVYQDTLPVGSL
jgi:hypothetical protein